MKYKVGLILTILGFILYTLFSKDKIEISQKTIEDRNISIAKEEVNNSTIPLKIKKSKPVVKQKTTNEVNETNETTVPKLCMKYKSGLLKWLHYKFDNQGRVITTIVDRNNDGKAEAKSSETYDDNGNLIKEIIETYQEREKLYGEDGRAYYSGNMQDIPTEIIEVTKEYDDENRLINNTSEENGLSERIHYEYNDKGDVVREINYRNDDLVRDYKVLYRYDKKGNIINRKYKIIESDNKPNIIDSLHTTKSYRYNKKNQLIEMLDSKYSWLTKYKYNKFGNVEEEKKYRPKFIRSDKMEEINRITYKYDKYGNLIEKKDSSGKILLQQKFGICGG